MTGGDKAGSFLPARLLAWIAEGTLERRFPAVVAFADVSGFTAMSERLATMGKEGAERLTGILNNYFTAMISRIHEGGGFVGKFGGDAMTIFFPAVAKEQLQETARCAVATCIDLQVAMGPFQDIRTKAGNFALGMKVGIGVGDVLFRVLTDAKGTRDYILAGLPLDRAAEAEHHGKSGDVILDAETIVALASRRPIGVLLEGGFVRLTAADWESAEVQKRESAREQNTQELEPPGTQALRHSAAIPFIDPAIYHRMLLGLDSVGEIRKVSILFLSFSGFDYDEDPEVGSKLDHLYGWVQRVTKSFDGSINKLDMGDKGSKILITFGTPTAHENDEQLSCRCGLELVESQEAHERWGGRVRAGIATGVVFAGEVGASTRQEYTVMGSTVNLAARLMTRAGPGELLIDDATHRRVEQLFDCRPPELVTLKGISQPIPVYLAVGLKTTAAQRAGERKPLVGRESELAVIQGVVGDVKEGRSRALIIRGEAGIGKSRLAGEAAALMREQGFAIGAGEALSYAKRSPYLSLISVLRGLMGITGAGEAALPQLERIVAEADPEHAFRAPIVAALLGIKAADNEITQHFDARLRQENLFDFLVQYFTLLTGQSPTAILIEDAQWVDRNTLELLAYLIRNLADRRLLVMLVRRPYSRKFISPHIGEIEKSQAVVTVNVREFGKHDLRAFALQELNASGMEEALLDFIYEKSQGNAAFTEELLRSLHTLGNLTLLPSEEGLVVTVVGNLAEVEVPDSLNSLIMSQLDRLGAESKLTVKLAAVIGRRFSRELVVGAYPVEMTPLRIGETLTDLTKLDVVKPEDDADLLNYIFKNLLTRDVAYDSLLFAHRREYHHRIGLCLEALHEEELAEQCEELARHFYQSEDDRRAVRYLSMAGDKAFDLFANESAEDYFTKALERAPADEPLGRFKLLSMRAKVYTVVGRSDAQKRDLDEALEIAEAQGDLKGKVNTLDNLAQYYFKVNELDTMERVIEEARAILDRIDHPVGRVMILIKMGALRYTRNDFQGALRQWQEGSSEAERIGDRTNLSVAITNCGLANKALGDLDRAHEHYQRSIEIDRAAGNLKSEAVNLGNLGVLYHQRGDFDAALEVYRRALEIGRGIGSKEIQARNLGNLAMIYQLRGERTKALQSQQEKLTIEQMMGYRRGQAMTLSNIGMWYAEDGELDQAVHYYEQALAIIRELELTAEEPRLMMNLGLVHHHRGDLDAALELLQRAVETAATVGHKVAEEYARRYLGFAYFDRGEFESADVQFRKSGEVAAALGSKVGIAGSKVGSGLVLLRQSGTRSLLSEGLAEVRKLGDVETLVVGEVSLAGWLIQSRQIEEALILLEDALEIARHSGRRRDVRVIEPLLESAQVLKRKALEQSGT